MDPSFDNRRGYFSQLPEIADLAISCDSKTMACILHGREGAQKSGMLYVAPITSPKEHTWMEELDWPATDIFELSFPTSDDIYFLVRPRVNIRSREEKATLVHVSLVTGRLESVIIKSRVSALLKKILNCMRP